MIAGYYDRSGWPNMYTGPTNGGVMPLDNSSWPTWSDGYDTYPNCPLVASKNGVDGRTTRGSIDDYWVRYESTTADPYITGGWTQHAWGNAIGDYMKTSQSAYSNDDGSTTFYNYTSSSNQLTCATMASQSPPLPDGTLGRKLFYEARGYTVTDCYNQKTDNKISGGFSFAQFKAEINAGRPVMLNLEGHTVVGVGYDDSQNLVYLHDTWDYSNHTMTWGASYSGMALQSVSIVNLSASGNTYTLTLAKAGTGDGTVSGGGAYAAGATVNLTATPNANSTFAGWSPSPCAASFTMPASNLTCTATFNLSQSPQPDLMVTSVTSPGSGVAGGKINVAMTVRNQGSQTAGSFWAGFYLSSNSTITTSDIDTGWGCTISSLAAGASHGCSGEIGIPTSVPNGTYYLGGYADSGNAVNESNETNNGLAAANTITIGGSGPTYTLTLAKTGTGNGTVSGGGNYAAGVKVTLTATPDANSTFVGWSPGPCAASFTMPANNLTCTATFLSSSTTYRPVYRFFNTSAGGHFFTMNEAERDSVIANLSWFRYEGISFYAYPVPTAGTSPVYRFFNTSAGGHFFTMSKTERDSVIANLPWFRDEGIGFYAYPAPTTGVLPVYRFFNTSVGGHFFTISEAERASVIANLPWFRDEGIGFYAQPY